MKYTKIAAYTGGIIATLHIIANVVIAFQISAGFTLADSLIPELVNALIVGVIVLLPAFILLKYKNFTKKWEKIALSYPIVLGLGLINLHFIADDPLEAGLPMVLIVMPYMLILSILLFTLGRQKDEAHSV